MSTGCKKGCNTNLFKNQSSPQEMTYLSNLLQCSIPLWKSREFTRLDWNHCHWGNRGQLLGGPAILKVRESLIFSRKSSRRIHGKWQRGDGKWSISAGYSVSTLFFYEQDQWCLFLSTGPARPRGVELAPVICRSAGVKGAPPVAGKRGYSFFFGGENWNRPKKKKGIKISSCTKAITSRTNVAILQWVPSPKGLPYKKWAALMFD